MVLSSRPKPPQSVQSAIRLTAPSSPNSQCSGKLGSVCSSHDAPGSGCAYERTQPTSLGGCKAGGSLSLELDVPEVLGEELPDKGDGDEPRHFVHRETLLGYRRGRFVIVAEGPARGPRADGDEGVARSIPDRIAGFSLLVVAAREGRAAAEDERLPLVARFRQKDRTQRACGDVSDGDAKPCGKANYLSENERGSVRA